MKLRPASFDDYAAIAALANRYGLVMKAHEGWLDLWRRNPAFPSTAPDVWPIGWVLVDAAGQIVGYLGNIPLAYVYKGRRLLAAATHAWVVETAARHASLLLLRAFLGQKKVDLLLCTTANPMSSRIFDAAKIPRMPVAGYDVSLYWITRHAGLLSSFLQKRGGLGAGYMGGLLRPLGALLDQASRVRRAWRYDTSRLSFLDSFDDGFDVFWEQLRTSCNCLLAVRDGAALSWRFRDALAQGHAWVLARRSQGTLNAYAIFLRQDNPAYRLTRMRLLDYQSVTEDPAVLAGFVTAALRRCHAEGIHLLESVGFTPELRRQLLDMGARERALPSWMFYYKANHSELVSDLIHPSAWYPSFYDGDGSIMEITNAIPSA